MSSLAADLKKSIGESIADAADYCQSAKEAVDTFLNKSRAVDLATIASLQSKLQGAQNRLRLAAVEEVPYFGGDLIKLAADARDKAHSIVQAMQLRGLTDVAGDLASGLGSSASNLLADILRPLLPILYGVAGIAVILAVAFFIIQRGKGRA